MINTVIDACATATNPAPEKEVANVAEACRRFVQDDTGGLDDGGGDDSVVVGSGWFGAKFVGLYEDERVNFVEEMLNGTHHEALFGDEDWLFLIRQYLNYESILLENPNPLSLRFVGTLRQYAKGWYCGLQRCHKRLIELGKPDVVGGEIFVNPLPPYFKEHEYKHMVETLCNISETLRFHFENNGMMNWNAANYPHNSPYDDSPAFRHGYENAWLFISM